MNKLRILIADKQDVFRRGIRSLLETVPEWDVCGEAATSSETIELTSALRPELLLLDVAMPGLDPAKAIPQIVDSCPTVKILALAVQDSAELAANALAAGANGLALKSESASELVLTVQEVGGGRPFLSAGAVTIIRRQLARIQHQLARIQHPVARPRATEPAWADLSPREVEVLTSLARGRSSKEIAGAFGISVKTISAHRANIMRTLNLRSYNDLVQFAVRSGIIES